MAHHSLERKRSFKRASKKATDYFSVGTHESDILPTFFINCVNHLEEHALDEEGILRIHGRTQDTQAINAFLSSGHTNEKRGTSLGQVDPHAVATLLKSYLNQGPPLLPMEQYSMFVDIGSKKEPEGEVLLFLRDVISGLPLSHQRVLHRVLIFIDNVQQHSAKNKMDPKALAIIFNPLLLRAPTEVSPAMILSQTQSCINCVLLLINNYQAIFEGMGLNYFDNPTSPALATRDSSLREFSSASSTKDKVKVRFLFTFTVKTGGCIRDTVSLFLKYAKQGVKRETGQTRALVCTNPQEVLWEEVVPFEVTLVVNKRTKIFEPRNFIVTLKCVTQKGSKTLGAASINLAELAPTTLQASPKDDFRTYEMMHKGGKLKSLILQVKSQSEWRKINNKLVVRQEESNANARRYSVLAYQHTGSLDENQREDPSKRFVALKGKEALLSMPNLNTYDLNRTKELEDERYPLSARDQSRSEGHISSSTPTKIPEAPFSSSPTSATTPTTPTSYSYAPSTIPPSTTPPSTTPPRTPPRMLLETVSMPDFAAAAAANAAAIAAANAVTPATHPTIVTTSTTSSEEVDKIGEGSATQSPTSTTTPAASTYFTSSSGSDTANMDVAITPADTTPDHPPTTATTLSDGENSHKQMEGDGEDSMAVQPKVQAEVEERLPTSELSSKEPSPREPPATSTEQGAPQEPDSAEVVANDAPLEESIPVETSPVEAAEVETSTKQKLTTPRDVASPREISSPLLSPREVGTKVPSLNELSRKPPKDPTPKELSPRKHSPRETRRKRDEKKREEKDNSENKQGDKDTLRTRPRSHSHSKTEKEKEREKKSERHERHERHRNKHAEHTSSPSDEGKKDETRKDEEEKKEEGKKEEPNKEKKQEDASADHITNSNSNSNSNLNTNGNLTSILRSPDSSNHTSPEINQINNKKEKRLTISELAIPMELASSRINSPTHALDDGESDLESDNDFDGLNSAFSQKLFELTEQIELLQQQRRQLELETFNLRKCLVHNEIYRPQTLDFSERGISSTAEQIIENLHKMNCFLEPQNFPASFFDSIIISLQQESKNEVEAPKILYWLSTTLGLLYLLSRSIKTIPDPSVLGVVALTQPIQIKSENGGFVEASEKSNDNLLHFARGIQATGLELYNRVLKLFEKQLDEEKLVLAFLGRPKEKEEKPNFVINKDKPSGIKTPEPVLTPAVALKEVVRDINENHVLLKDAKIFDNFAFHLALHRLFYLDHLLVHELSIQKKLYSTDAQTIKQATAEIEQCIRGKFPSHSMPCPLKMTTQFVGLVTAEFSKLDSETYVNNSFTLLKPSQILQILEVLRPDKDSRKPVPTSVQKVLQAMAKSEAEKPRIVPVTWHLSDELTKLTQAVH